MSLLRESVAIVMVLAITGCTTYGPLLGESSMSNGFTETRTSSSTFQLRYDGQTGQSYENLRKLLVRRTMELCTGSFSFLEYKEEEGMALHARKFTWPVVTAVVECGPPPIQVQPWEFGK